MKRIETTLDVTAEGTALLELGHSVRPGKHRAVVMIDEEAEGKRRRKPPLDLTPYPVGLTDDRFTFRREDLYGDDGR